MVGKFAASVLAYTPSSLLVNSWTQKFCNCEPVIFRRGNLLHNLHQLSSRATYARSVANVLHERHRGGWSSGVAIFSTTIQTEGLTEFVDFIRVFVSYSWTVGFIKVCAMSVRYRHPPFAGQVRFHLYQERFIFDGLKH
jgi:hypothetical protein